MLNNITIQGRLVKDPELRRTQSGKAVTSFTLACDRDFASESGTREADFLDCVSWGNQAEMVCKYFHKGQQAVVAGRMFTRKYTDKDGNKRVAYEINAASIYFCGNREDNGSAPPQGSPQLAAKPQRTDSEPLEDDQEELPF